MIINCKSINYLLLFTLAEAATTGLSVDQVPEPHFTGPIENITVAVGKEAILSCYVQNLGTYKVSHFWPKNGEVLENLVGYLLEFVDRRPKTED